MVRISKTVTRRGQAKLGDCCSLPGASPSPPLSERCSSAKSWGSGPVPYAGISAPSCFHWRSSWPSPVFAQTLRRGAMHFRWQGSAGFFPDITASSTLVWSPNHSRLAIRPSHRSEEHTSQIQSLMRTSYPVSALKQKDGRTRALCQPQADLELHIDPMV